MRTEVRRFREALPLTTGIGSLPHHNVDAALAYSFRYTLPFLPQIPIRNPWEYMIPQALEGLPGLQVRKDGTLELKQEIWESRAVSFGERLRLAFEEGARRPTGFESFEPNASTSSCWQAFVWEASERGASRVKIQLAGPLTCQLAVDVSIKAPASELGELGNQCFQLLLARAISMVRRLKQEGIECVFYWDEPGFAFFNEKIPAHALHLRELGIAVKTLQKEGAIVGIHCCSDANWKAIFSLSPDILSIDGPLTLPHLLDPTAKPFLEAFLTAGGILSLGIIDTRDHSIVQAHPNQLLAGTRAMIPELTELTRPIRGDGSLMALLTPACGLALHSIEEAENFASLLEQCEQACRSVF